MTLFIHTLNDKHKDKGDKTISPDPERFTLLRHAWEMLLSGAYSVPALQTVLNEEWGIRTAVTRSGRGGRALAKSTLYRLFGSIFYAGYFIHDGLLYKGAHEPMVTLEEFDRVQQILGKKSSGKKSLSEATDAAKPKSLHLLPAVHLLPPGSEASFALMGQLDPCQFSQQSRLQSRSHDLPFTGLIRCGGCGGQVTGGVVKKPSGRSYTYYHCQGKGGCSKRGVPQHRLESMIDAELAKVDLRPEFHEWAIHDIERGNVQEQAERQAVYDQKLKALREADSLLDALLGMRLRGLITDEEYTEKRTQLTRDRAHLHEAAQSVEMGADRAREACLNAADFMRHAREWLASGDAALKRVVAFNLGSNYILQDGNLLLEPHPMLVRVNNEYKGFEEKYQAIQLEENSSGSIQTGALAPIRTVWSGIWEANRTEALKSSLSFPKIAVSERVSSF